MAAHGSRGTTLHPLRRQVSDPPLAHTHFPRQGEPHYNHDALSSRTTLTPGNDVIGPFLLEMTPCFVNPFQLHAMMQHKHSENLLLKPCYPQRFQQRTSINVLNQNLKLVFLHHPILNHPVNVLVDIVNKFYLILI